MLQGNYLDNLTREGFRIAHETSCYSFAAVGKAAIPLLSSNSALLTLSYIGAIRAMPSYNIMGVAKASLESNIRYMASNLDHTALELMEFQWPNKNTCQLQECERS